MYLTVLIPKELQALDLCPTPKSMENIPLNMPLSAKDILIKRAVQVCGVEGEKEAQTLSHRENDTAQKPSWRPSPSPHADAETAVDKQHCMLLTANPAAGIW